MKSPNQKGGGKSVSTRRTTEINEDILRKNRFKMVTGDNYLSNSVIYTANQTATEFIATPGEGYRIVIKYLALRTGTNTGIMKFTGTLNEAALVMGMVYVSSKASFGTGVISIALDENTNITITTTTGNNDIFAAIEYIIEAV